MDKNDLDIEEIDKLMLEISSIKNINLNADTLSQIFKRPMESIEQSINRLRDAGFIQTDSSGAIRNRRITDPSISFDFSSDKSKKIVFDFLRKDSQEVLVIDEVLSLRPEDILELKERLKKLIHEFEIRSQAVSSDSQAMISLRIDWTQENKKEPYKN